MKMLLINAVIIIQWLTNVKILTSLQYFMEKNQIILMVLKTNTEKMKI